MNKSTVNRFAKWFFDADEKKSEDAPEIDLGGNDSAPEPEMDTGVDSDLEGGDEENSDTSSDLGDDSDIGSSDSGDSDPLGIGDLGGSSSTGGSLGGSSGGSLGGMGGSLGSDTNSDDSPDSEEDNSSKEEDDKKDKEKEEKKETWQQVVDAVKDAAPTAQNSYEIRKTFLSSLQNKQITQQDLQYIIQAVTKDKELKNNLVVKQGLEKFLAFIYAG